MDNLDTVDKAVIEAIKSGKTDAEIMIDLDVSEDKVASMHGFIANSDEEIVADTTEETVTAPVVDETTPESPTTEDISEVVTGEDETIKEAEETI